MEIRLQPRSFNPWLKQFINLKHACRIGHRDFDGYGFFSAFNNVHLLYRQRWNCVDVDFSRSERNSGSSCLHIQGVCNANDACFQRQRIVGSCLCLLVSYHGMQNFRGDYGTFLFPVCGCEDFVEEFKRKHAAVEFMAVSNNYHA